MKTILVLTDFSENAKHAAKSAMCLSENLHADIFLYNSFVMAPAAPYYAGGPIVTEGIMWYSDESKDLLKKLAEDLETNCDHCSDGQFKPKITCANGEGNLGKDVVDIIKHKDIELVVMGARSGGTIEHILIGSDTNSVINHTTRPVLVIPPQSDFKGIKKIVFATDFNDVDIKALNYLKGLQKIFHCEMEVVHVSLNNEDDKKNFGQEVVFASMVNSLNDADLSYKTIRGKDVVNRLNRLCHETKADVLALVHYKDSFLSRILEPSKTKDALSHQKVPLLIIPSKMV
jgi:nucleotide-binding universal stress UspA family protein